MNRKQQHNFKTLKTEDQVKLTEFKKKQSNDTQHPFTIRALKEE